MTVTYSRSLHSAAFSFIGAMGFLASAVLPADSYLVWNSLSTVTRIVRRMLIVSLNSLDTDV